MTAAASAAMPRRDALGVLAASVITAGLPAFGSAADRVQPLTRLGLVTFCCRLMRDALKNAGGEDLFEPIAFLEHCRSLGAGGIQAELGVRDDAYTRTLRETAARHDMFVEAIVQSPQTDSDVERFDAEMATAAKAGALAARTTIIPGRRYEFFDSLDRFREFVARGRRSLELAAPIAEKHRIPLAVENHKDQRTDERIALFEHIGSEYVGACVDTGNSFALLEDPQQTVERLAPYAFSVHLKDQAVQEYKQGFVLADIPLGDGFFDLKRMVETLGRAKPNVRFSLELITRDPLTVPCLTEKYWATMPDVPANELARTLQTVRRNAAASLPSVDSLTPEAQVSREVANVRASLDYARKNLRL